VARLSLRLSLLCALVACAVTAPSASADLLPGLLSGVTGRTCGTLTQPFAQFGDPALYAFAPNGGLETGPAGWSLSGGARVVSENEPFYAHATTDRYSLLLPNGARAVSPGICFGTLTPGVRFFAKSPSGSGTVHVRLITRSLLGVLSILDGGTVRVGGSWAPVDKVDTLGSQLAVLAGTKSIQVELVASGDVQVDDLYVDPFFQES
jgi:hypothetical protein